MCENLESRLQWLIRMATGQIDGIRQLKEGLRPDLSLSPLPTLQGFPFPPVSPEEAYLRGFVRGLKVTLEMTPEIK